MKDLFKPIKAKYGYKDLQDIGFYCTKSDRCGDWHKSNAIPNIRVLGSYLGYDLYVKSDGFGCDSYKGYVHVNRHKDIESLKEAILSEGGE